MKRGKVLVVVLALILSSCAGKNVTVTNLPAGVPQSAVQNWISATNDLNQAYSATHTVVQAILQLHTTGVFPDGPAYGATLTAIGKAEVLEDQAARFLKTVPNDWGQSTVQQVTSWTEQILTQLATASSQAVLGIKDSTTAQAFAQTITNIVSIIKLVQGLASSVSAPATPTPAVTPPKPSGAQLFFPREVAYV